MANIRDETTQLSPLKRAYLALEQTQSKLDALQRARTEPIAIVGIGCRLPGGADSPEAYWRLLHDGVDAVCEVPRDRWDIDAYYDRDPAVPGKMCTRYGGFLRERIDEFEPQFFGISPREAESMDPQQRLLLEVSWEALENGAQFQARLAGSPTGVFIGITSHDYSDIHLGLGNFSQLTTYNITGSTHNAAAGRLSYCLGFQGPCMAIDTACSSSLVATHLACRSLLNDECRQALAGGVNLILSPLATIALSQGKVLAPDGRCRAFDEAAAGMVRGEGCAIVVLKRLSHASEDGDNILALIRSSAVNQDGPSSGLTVPNGPAQVALIRAALASANISPGEIDYIEAHGTGTPLGDPIELRALGNVFAAERDRPLVVGSVKTNLGHLEACAGIAGLIKVVLCLQQQTISPNLNFQHPTPHVSWDELRLVVPTQPRPWTRGERPRLAGVSSFGFSGVNAHIVLQEAPSNEASTLSAGPDSKDQQQQRPLHLLTLAGRTKAALTQLAQRYVKHLGEHTDLAVEDVCYSANAGRSHPHHRVGLVVASIGETRDKLSAFLKGQAAPGLLTQTSSLPPKVAFLFTGQGSQYLGMGRELYETQPTFRHALEQCDKILRPHLPRPLLNALFSSLTEESALDETIYTQPGLFALEYALAELWKSWGILPAVVMGHSVGEYVAACVAGVFSLEDGLRFISERARLMQSLPRDGAMFALMAAQPQVEAAIRLFEQEVSIAAVNGPQNIVISGRREPVETVVAGLQKAGVKAQRLNVSHAFHSPLMESILSAFESKASEVAYSQPQISLVSNVTGQLAAADIATAEYWRRHVRSPVRFMDGVETMRDKGCTHFVELGPKPTLSSLAQQCLDGEQFAWLPSLRPGHSDWRQMLQSLAALYVDGAHVNWAGFDRDYPRRRVALPTYPFQRQRCWMETNGSRLLTTAISSQAKQRTHPLLGYRLDLAATQEIRFESQISRHSPAFLQDHCIFDEVILPASAYLEMVVAAGAVALKSENVMLLDVAFQQALILPENEPTTVQLVLKPDGSNGFTFEIHSLTSGESGPSWVHHAAGRIVEQAANAAGRQVDPVGLKAAAIKEIDPRQIYQQCHAVGVGLGPSFQAVKQLWTTEAGACGEIELPVALAADAHNYKLHPVMLDAAFQVMCAATADAVSQDAYLPVALDCMRLHARGDTTGWSQVQVRKVHGTSEDSLRVDLQLFAAGGQPVATIEGLHLKRTSRDMLLQSVDTTSDWLYEVEWRPQPLRVTRSGPDYLPTIDEVRAALPQLATSLAAQLDSEQFDTVIGELESLSVDYSITALRQLGLVFSAGQRFSTDSLAEQLGIVSQYRRLLNRMLEAMAEEGILTRQNSQWEVRSRVDEREPSEKAEALLAQHPAALVEFTMLNRCGMKLAEVLAGKCDPLGLLFSGAEAVTAANLYGDSPGAHASNVLVQRLITLLLDRLPENRHLRMLEIGAGTGGTTAGILPVLPSRQTEYTFTDVSPLFVKQAADKFRDYPFMRYRVLDIEQAPGNQGLDDYAYDVIVAANVLHATRDLRKTLGYARRLLAPLGMLVLLEGTMPLRFIDLIFGLTDGWWRFADHDLRPSHPLLAADRWLKLLAECGFDHATAHASPPEAKGIWSKQALIVAQASAKAPVRNERQPSDWLILATERSEIARQLKARVESDGNACTLVLPGQQFERVAADEFRIDPASASDFWKLFQATSRTGRRLAHVLHLWGLEDVTGESLKADGLEAAFELGCGAVLHLVQAITAKYPNEPPTLWLVTCGAQVAGSYHELPGLAQSTLWGMGKVVALEHPELRCTCIDVDPHADGRAANPLFEEINSNSAEDQVAFRQNERFVARLVRHQGSVSRGGPRVEADGTYLITGGHRGLGLLVARWLVEQGARTLVLVGRRGIDDAARDPLAEMEQSGATIEVVRADVTDHQQVAHLLAQIDSTLPPLRGIVHCAGILDDGIMQQQSWDRFRQVLAPKVSGAWHLHTLTQHKPLDFFVLFSSFASLLGSAGQANHAAANAFLDALAHDRRSRGLPALSINWGAWSEIGAAARGDVDRRVKAKGMGVIAPRQGLRIFARLLAGSAAQVGVAPIDWPAFARQSGNGKQRPFYAEFASRHQPTAGDRSPRQIELRRQLRQASAEKRAVLVVSFIREQVAAVLSLDLSDVDLHQPLNRMGLDSLMAVELRNRLRTQLGVDVSIVEFMGDQSIADLATHVCQQLRALDLTADRTKETSIVEPCEIQNDPSQFNREIDPQNAERILAQLDQLTDEQVDAMLRSALSESKLGPIES